MKTLKYLLVLVAFIWFSKAFSQSGTSDIKREKIRSDSSKAAIDSARQKDLIDIIKKILKKKPLPANAQSSRKATYSIVPYIGYSLSTGFSLSLSGNATFFTSNDISDNISLINGSISYDTRGQKIFFGRSEIWTSGNNYKIVTDMALESYPTNDFGLGTLTTADRTNPINYNYAKIYETILKKVSGNYYAGIGYDLDYHFKISEASRADNTVTDYERYGETPRSTSSGVTLDLLYDNRKNPINPLSGGYASIVYRENLTFLGSNSRWQSLQLDLRKYIKLSPGSNNVLALWGLATFTSGNTPYLDLPATGSDRFNNSGRGYVLGRFRGKDMLYFEGEYRFGLTRNGLLGAVVFANAESFTEYPANTFEKFAPAAGAGLRVKLNKHSNTNICFDYGYGMYGSHGFFINLGELF